MIVYIVVYACGWSLMFTYAEAYMDLRLPEDKGKHKLVVACTSLLWPVGAVLCTVNLVARIAKHCYHSL